MILTRSFDFDIIPGGAPLLIRASHNDTSSALILALLAGEGLLEIPTGTTARIRGRETDKVGVLSFDGRTPTVTIALDKTMTGERGHIQTVSGNEKWDPSTVKSMLKNEKYMGDLLLQKYYIPDFLTKKVRKNRGELPQYYVENAHAPIVPKEVFLRAQGILLQRRQSPKRGRVRNENALFGNVICGECGDIYRRYKGKEGTAVPETKWRCRARTTKYSDCRGRAITEAELKTAIVKAFNSLPKQRDKLIRMQERIRSGELAQVNREIAEIDDKTSKLDQIISGYAKTGKLSARNLALYGDGDPEAALDRISAELNEMSARREQLMLKKGELGMREVQTHSLLKLIDAILEKEDEKVEGNEDGSCSDIETFYGLTDRIVQWGLLKEYDNELFKRFVEKVVVREKGIEVVFKAGISVKV